ncbi:MAG: hypothetical protein M3R48_00550 [Candidatus Dormibacteraeota bacterium]|nr:hypothetical protein [Candidatus Dormibacteraeota bacterium]
MNNTKAVALIERAERERPCCDCGQPMVSVARDGGMWLECASRQGPASSSVRRLLAALTTANHSRRLILDPA